MQRHNVMTEPYSPNTELSRDRPPFPSWCLCSGVSVIASSPRIHAPQSGWRVSKGEERKSPPQNGHSSLNPNCRIPLVQEEQPPEKGMVSPDL